MTGFFLAGLEPDGTAHDEAHDEAAYDELRERSRIAFGCPAKARRIFKLQARLDGHDCDFEVGRPLPGGDDVVVAILDHGRDESFAVYTDAGQACAVRVGHPAYSVTEFS